GSGTRSARLAEIANRDARPATRGHTVPGRPTTARGVTMFEWSETDLMIRDGIRGFIAKEIRPHLDALDSGEMSPYPIIRKLFSEFGIDVMASEAVEKMLAKERARDAGEPGSGETGSGETGSGKSGETSAPEKEEASSGGSGAFEGQDSLMAVVVSELAGACMGMVSALGVSIGLGATTLMSRGTLAQKERWLPGIATMEKVAAWAITEPDSGSDAFGGMQTYVRRDGD